MAKFVNLSDKEAGQPFLVNTSRVTLVKEDGDWLHIFFDKEHTTMFGMYNMTEADYTRECIVNSWTPNTDSNACIECQYFSKCTIRIDDIWYIKPEVWYDTEILPPSAMRFIHNKRVRTYGDYSYTTTEIIKRIREEQIIISEDDLAKRQRAEFKQSRRPLFK